MPEEKIESCVLDNRASRKWVIKHPQIEIQRRIRSLVKKYIIPPQSSQSILPSELISLTMEFCDARTLCTMSSICKVRVLSHA